MSERRRRFGRKNLVDTALSIQGNYSTAKSLRHEKKASMNNKYLEKIAEIEGTIHGPSYKARKNWEIAQRALKSKGAKEVEESAARVAKLKKAGKVGAGVAAGLATAGALGYRAKKRTEKKQHEKRAWTEHEKRAWTEQCMKAKAIAAAKAAKTEMKKEAGWVGAALGAAKNFAKGAVADAPNLAGQAKNVVTAAKANKGVFNKGTMSTVKALAGNRALQAGAGLAAGGYAAGRALNKQSSLADNKYLQKIAMFEGFGQSMSNIGSSMSSGLASMGKSLSSIMPKPSIATGNSTIGIRG